jgi:hypothetical protein
MEDDPGVKYGLDFYLKRMDLDTALKDVQIVALSSVGSADLDPRDIALVVVNANLSAAIVDGLNRFLAAGGNVLAVLSNDQPLGESQSAAWQSLLGLPSLQIEPRTADDYALLAGIDFDHALFSPFAAAKYRDFSKIRFWRYRNISASHENPWKVLARFDDGAPALVELGRGSGRLWVLTSGWHADDSQLGLSSKFVPLIAGMFDAGDTSPIVATSQVVGRLMLPECGRPARLVRPDGSVETLGGNVEPILAREPGIHRLETPQQSWQIAVNLAATEGDTRELDLGQLEQRGVRLGKHRSAAEWEAEQRQLRDVELEARQRSWRYLIVGALVALGMETWLAGRRRSAGSASTNIDTE